MREVLPIVRSFSRFHHKRLAQSFLHGFLLFSLFSCGLVSLPMAHSASSAVASRDVRSDVYSEEILATSSQLVQSGAPNLLLAQADSQSQSSNQSWSDKDTSNLLTGLLVLLILPLFWGPTRKAVGLLNIIVGTMLTITGIGAVFGIPMILVGGVCLFV